ncbi:MAG: 30S ribosomal protein S8 [Parcubacteria group bacterium CG_4_9_14_0_2_um_filter_41_8]|nr:MAG: 30S ribosomal protein S8 [Parcubacteria group bacterium CG1_02_41_12]PIP67440.1 MAG: 30S ribosomal protein S8 [Parcubacteria group bacterium CG22_combo_CG10-13_8_21_14_all_41_9]PIQ79383.1 MAG: 30S ribosomal protein S8 [Parcubacteria group bacterium CG11_big_fil_rev_8_21_14_0_20_41_14]PIR57523.1 MAG: 30S ribosomal protein S8 [Parcubacteria group bacterium CG10_big_fil_rev_8_21_14_0_10_41_35]PIZ81265.1 MAG: 30S ribosomal protein S8 [Parcubacteria group bacterium CG_4_10_14_0_2_um_filter_4
MMTDPIADMLTRMRNSLAARKERVLIPSSKLKMRLAGILEKENYIISANEKEVNGRKNIEIKLKYKKDGSGAIQTIKRVSKPGLRVYSQAEDLPTVLQGYGIAIISTPEGLLTNKEARKRGIGGEIICQVS